MNPLPEIKITKNIFFNPYTLGYGFLFGNKIHLAKDFFLEIFKIYRMVWIFLWIFGCFESISSKYNKKLTKNRATSKI
jgi:hypothetical protein